MEILETVRSGGGAGEGSVSDGVGDRVRGGGGGQGSSLGEEAENGWAGAVVSCGLGGC